MIHRNSALRRRSFPSAFYLLPSAFCLLFSSCQRGPQTADELQAQLPRQYRGDIRLQGDMQTHRLVVEPRDLQVRNAHVLEFHAVRYQLVTGGQVMAEGDAELLGTISAPGLEVRIEQAAGTGDAIRANTFEGHLDRDLQTGKASWTNALGQHVGLELRASGP